MVTRDDIVDFLQTHRLELLALRDLIDDADAQERADIAHRLACIDALLTVHGGRAHRRH